MKKSKHSRKIGYGIAGAAIGLVIFLLLQSKAPVSVDARSTLTEFKKESSLEYVLDDEDYNGIVKPFLEYGSYHVSSADYIEYEKNGVVKYGKSNPTYFLTKEPPKEEVDEKDTPEEGVEKDTKESDLPSTGENKTYENCTELTKDYPEGVEKGHIAYQAELDRDKDGWACEQGSDNTKNASDNSGGNELEGFNIHTGQLETVDVSHIESQFRQYGVLPVDKEHYRISSNYGKRVDPFEKTAAYHVGLDLATQSINGANIYSVLPGEVVQTVSGDKGLGNYIVVKHEGFETLYAHMISPSTLKKGDIVEAGDVLGYVGTTGRSTGPHLHFEVGIGGLKLDPLRFINLIEGIE